MFCNHCLRGEAEDIEINNNILREALKNITYINNLSISGGEPFQASIIRWDMLISWIKEYNIKINNIFILTNGKDIPFEKMRPIFDLSLIAKVHIYWSNDSFHETLSPRNKEFLRFFGIKELYKYPKDNFVLNEGKAKTLSEYAYDKEEVALPLIYRKDNTDIDYGNFYLNCEGLIINGSDWSYEDQRYKEEIKICKFDNFNENSIDEYSEKYLPY